MYGTECNTVALTSAVRHGDLAHSRCLYSVSVLFSVVTNVVGMCGENLEGFLSGKHYILLNHVFIPD